MMKHFYNGIFYNEYTNLLFRKVNKYIGQLIVIKEFKLKN